MGMLNKNPPLAPNLGEVANAALQALCCAAISRHETQFIMLASAATFSKGTRAIPTVEESKTLARQAFDMVIARAANGAASGFVEGLERERDGYIEFIEDRYYELLQLFSPPRSPSQ